MGEGRLGVAFLWTNVEHSIKYIMSTQSNAQNKMFSIPFDVATFWVKLGV